MLNFLTRRAKWVIALLAVLVFLLTISGWLDQSAFWQKIEGAAIDRRYVLHGASDPHPDIKVIGIVNTSLALDPNTSAFSPEEIESSEALQLMQQPWPWDRRVYAELLERLMSAGAKVVMIDLVFASETEGDDVLAKALEKYKDRVVVGSMFSYAKRENDETELRYIQPNPSVVPDSALPVVGFVNSYPDFDGVTRRARYVTSMYRELAQVRGMDLPEDDEQLLSLSAVTAQKFRGKLPQLPSEHANFLNFAGPQNTYPVFAIEQAFVDRLWEAPPFKGGTVFKDKIVLVGPYAEILHDIHQTPWGVMPGPEVQANMLASLLTNSFLREPSRVVNRAVVAGLIVLAAVICMFMRNAILQLVLLGFVAGGFLVVVQQMFAGSRLLIPVVPPLFGLIATGVSGVGFRYFLEQLEKKRVRSMLDRYVSKNVAKTILNDTRSFVDSLRGRKQPVTVLFSDIRGFTSMTEGTEATTLVSQLNEYFLDMVSIVHRHEGTLQKFIGDAIMAAWGDTHSHGLETDARKAVKTALDMRAALAKLNEGWVGKSDRMKLSIGVGVNHGEVVVGNIGHPDFRMEFTVLGDGVNLAARLESATKQFKTDILVGQEAEKLTRGDFIYRSVGAIAFKGKTQPVEVYMILGEKGEPVPEWLHTYHEALELYRKRCFEQAVSKFTEAREKIGEEDYLCGMYLEKCESCRSATLPETWDGSFALTEK